MRPIHSILGVLAVCAAVVGGGGCATADRPVLSSPTAITAAAYQPVVVEVVGDSGGLPAYLYGGSVFVEGRHGEHYALRVSNNSGQRVEAVVSVDGRDVVSGQVGNYNKQRGYVIEPWSSVVIDGYRQSLDSVAAFRFSELSASYSARRGTPQYVGVIGVAVFGEKPSRAAKTHHPISVGGYPYERSAADAAAPEAPFPDAPRRAAASDDAEAAHGGAFAPAPVPTNTIGTAYGESRTSMVHETRFVRHHKRRPDAVLTVHYDSHDGLQARGVLPYAAWEPTYDSHPEPFPGPYASPPPPVWR